jgi:hypothetical protein
VLMQQGVEVPGCGILRRESGEGEEAPEYGQEDEGEGLAGEQP